MLRRVFLRWLATGDYLMQNILIVLTLWFVVAIVVSIGLGFFLQAVRHLHKKRDALWRMRNAGF